MTIALAIKVNDGVVLTADSATTFFGFEEGRDRLDTTNVYNNGEKITNIHKELALGIMTWGIQQTQIARKFLPFKPRILFYKAQKSHLERAIQE